MAQQTPQSDLHHYLKGTMRWALLHFQTAIHHTIFLIDQAEDGQMAQFRKALVNLGDALTKVLVSLNKHIERTKP